MTILKKEGLNPLKSISKEDNFFFDDAVSAMAGIGAYGSPVYFQLAEFKQRESSGIQITRHPGQNIFYLGCLMLIVGIFMMFYISYQRIWILLKPENGQLKVIFAGSGNRNERDFSAVFDDLASTAKAISTEKK